MNEFEKYTEAELFESILETISSWKVQDRKWLKKYGHFYFEVFRMALSALEKKLTS